MGMGLSMKRHAGVISAGVAVTLAMAGCGSSPNPSAKSSGSGTPANALLAAYQHTMAAKTAKFSLQETVNDSAGGSSSATTINGNGAISLSGDSANITFSLPSGGALQMRLITPNLYLQVPATDRSQVPGQKPWIQLNLDQVSKAKLGASLSQLSSASHSASDELSYLQGAAAGGVRQVGVQTIRGVATTHYNVDVNLNKVAAKESGAAASAIKKLEGELHSSTLPVQVWVDHQSRVRQLSYALTVPVPASSSASSTSGTSTSVPAGTAGQVKVQATVDYYHFGAPVRVSAPTANQVYDATSQATGAVTSTSTSAAQG